MSVHTPTVTLKDCVATPIIGFGVRQVPGVSVAFDHRDPAMVKLAQQPRRVSSHRQTALISAT